MRVLTVLSFCHSLTSYMSMMKVATLSSMLVFNAFGVSIYLTASNLEVVIPRLTFILLRHVLDLCELSCNLGM